MSFWSNPGKAIRGAISQYVPGGSYLTGDAARRQKFHYDAALSRYNSYATAAQSQIEAMTQSLQQSMQLLQSLEHQQERHSLAGQSLNAQASEYASLLSSFENAREAANNEASELEKAALAFKAKAPELIGKISEAEKLPKAFAGLYEGLAKQKEQLKGLSEEEAASSIRKHREDVEALKKQRQESENKIRLSLAEIGSEHANLKEEKAKLEQRLDNYSSRQDRLYSESSKLEQKKNSLQRMLQDYKNEQERINSEYSQQQARVSSQQQNLRDYIAAAQLQLNALGQEVQWRAGKYGREARTSGLVQGGALALGGLALGAGLGHLAAGSSGIGASLLSAAGTGLKYGLPAFGAWHYLSKTGKSRLIGSGFEPVELGGRGNDGADLAGRIGSRLNLPKTAIRELGGLKQSLSHFEMPTVPKLQDLPRIDEALGKIASLKDIEGLSLGLPSITAASGKKYSAEVLYNPDFIKKLRKVSRNLATPYLPYSFAVGLGGGSSYGK